MGAIVYLYSSYLANSTLISGKGGKTTVFSMFNITIFHSSYEQIQLLIKYVDQIISNLASRVLMGPMTISKQVVLFQIVINFLTIKTVLNENWLLQYLQQTELHNKSKIGFFILWDQVVSNCTSWNK